MLRLVPNWVLWIVIPAAALASPFIAMLLLFVVGEMLWDVGSTIGPGPSLGVCGAALVSLVFYWLRPRPPQPEAGLAD